MISIVMIIGSEVLWYILVLDYGFIDIFLSMTLNETTVHKDSMAMTPHAPGRHEPSEEMGSDVGYI
jgi:hypothetical protein